MTGQAPEGSLEVHVVFAQPEAFVERVVRLPEGATVGEALRASGLVEELGLDPVGLQVGVYGRVRRLGHVLASGDRVEIYRPLLKAPNEARLARARLRSRKRSAA